MKDFLVEPVGGSLWIGVGAGRHGVGWAGSGWWVNRVGVSSEGGGEPCHLRLISAPLAEIRGCISVGIFCSLGLVCRIHQCGRGTGGTDKLQ